MKNESKSFSHTDKVNFLLDAGFTSVVDFCNDYISSDRKSLQKWLRKYNINKNFIMTNVDIDNDTKYTINNDTNNLDTRDLHK